MAEAKSTAPPAPPNTRTERALYIYRHHRHEIERLSEDIYLVPSTTTPAMYRVDYTNETCSCPDHTRRGELCKHILCVGIVRAKRRAKTCRCDGCKKRLRRRDLIEVMDWHLDFTLSVFEGERYCCSCAHNVGIL